jgi:hypothetical protein
VVTFVRATADLFAVVERPQPDSLGLIFHRRVQRNLGALELRVRAGRIVGVNFGCIQPPEELMRDRTIVAGPWYEYDTRAPAPPQTGIAVLDERLREVHDADPALRDSAYAPPLYHEACRPATSDDPLAPFVTPTAATLDLYGLYEGTPDPPEDGWPPGGWWVVYRQEAGEGWSAFRLHIDEAGQVAGLWMDCPIDLHGLTLDASGEPLRAVPWTRVP